MILDLTSGAFVIQYIELANQMIVSGRKHEVEMGRTMKRIGVPLAEFFREQTEAGAPLGVTIELAHTALNRLIVTQFIFNTKPGFEERAKQMLVEILTRELDQTIKLRAWLMANPGLSREEVRAMMHGIRGGES